MSSTSWRRFHGWRIVAAGAVMSAIGSALVIQGFAGYSVLLREEFGWSTGLIAIAFALNRAESGLLGPIQGWMIDRFGPRRVIQIGAVVMAVGFVLFSEVRNLWQFFVFYPVLAIGVALAGFLTHVTTVVNWFERRRSLAIAVYMSGFAMGGLLTPGVIWYLERYGWRDGARASAVLCLLVMLPLSLVFHHRPEDIGLRVDGSEPDDDDSGEATEPTTAVVNFTAAEAVRTRAFWLISLGHMSALLVVSSVLAHLALHLTDDRGVSLQRAGFIMGSLPILQLVGQFSGGYLGDRLNKRRLAAGCMVSHVLALLILAHVGAMWAVIVFIPLHGVAWGLRGPLMQSLRADYFGPTSFGQILGLSSMIVMLGSVIGPLLAGTLNDATGSYTIGFTIIAGLASTGVVLFLAATPPEPPRRSPPTTVG